MLRLYHDELDAIARRPAGPGAHVCGDDHLTDPAHRLSTHCTSVGTVVYYRCSCGRVRVGWLSRP